MSSRPLVSWVVIKDPKGGAEQSAWRYTAELECADGVKAKVRSDWRWLIGFAARSRARHEARRQRAGQPGLDGNRLVIKRGSL